jgi:hypothetical protein
MVLFFVEIITGVVTCDHNSHNRVVAEGEGNNSDEGEGGKGDNS